MEQAVREGEGEEATAEKVLDRKELRRSEEIGITRIIMLVGGLAMLVGSIFLGAVGPYDYGRGITRGTTSSIVALAVALLGAYLFTKAFWPSRWWR